MLTATIAEHVFRTRADLNGWQWIIRRRVVEETRLLRRKMPGRPWWSDLSLEVARGIWIEALLRTFHVSEPNAELIDVEELMSHDAFARLGRRLRQVRWA